MKCIGFSYSVFTYYIIPISHLEASNAYWFHSHTYTHTQIYAKTIDDITSHELMLLQTLGKFIGCTFQ